MSEYHGAIQLFLKRIEGRRPLSQEARDAFLALEARTDRFDTYRDIVSEGARTTRCCLIAEGCASRYKTLPNGGRQINSFHFPGDMVDLQSGLMVVADHGIRTHSPTTILWYECNDILRLAADFPEWSRALWFDTLVEAAIFREWTVNVGRRSAAERTAHLLLEIAWRLEEIGESDGRTFKMPVTQVDLSDAVGLSPVHTNRTLQKLRESGMIRTYGKTIVIENREAMVRQAAFDDRYLHPEGPRAL